MAWRLAKSLTTLRNQVNEAYPKRSKASDGTIGDSSHASRPSDHNPNSKGVVTALDLTHDPANGFDAHKLANTLIANRHPNLEYVISNKRIAGAWTNWRWQSYSGSNPHTKHIHVSVGDGRADGQALGNYDSTTKWNIGGSDMADASDVKHIYKYGPLRRTADAGGLKHYTGMKPDFIINDHRNSAEGKQRAAELAKWKADSAEVPKLKAEIADLKAQLGKPVDEEGAVRSFFEKLIGLVYKK